jgi:hypothetical protein
MRLGAVVISKGRGGVYIGSREEGCGRSAWRATSPGALCTVASGMATASDGEVRGRGGRVHSG